MLLNRAEQMDLLLYSAKDLIQNCGLQLLQFLIVRLQPLSWGSDTGGGSTHDVVQREGDVW